MTKKHFEEVASILCKIPRKEKEKAAILFANSFEAKYPKFKREKFLKACGL